MGKTTPEKKILAAALGDVDELIIDLDALGIIRLKGSVLTGGVYYNLRLRRNDSHDPDSSTSLPAKYLYTGTVSMIDPSTNRVLVSEIRRRKWADRGKTGIDKDFYASITLRFNETAIKKIASLIRQKIDDLYEENKSQYEAISRSTMTPDQVTPLFAVNNYADTFLSVTYSPSGENDARKRSIHKVFSLLPSIPFKQMNKRAVTSALRVNSVTENNINLCYLFVAYLIYHKKIDGVNPFPEMSSQEISQEKRDQKAFTISELTLDNFKKLFELMNNTISTVYCGIALLASGFSASEVLSLKWSDIEFKLGFADFVIVFYLRDQVTVAKHDFSRPVIPDCALYLRKVYEHLCEEYGADTVKSWHIVTKDRSEDKRLSTKELSSEANDLLVRAGYVGRLSSSGRPDENQEPIPIRLLTLNYRRMLLSAAGLASDDDTYNFLCGTLLRSSTFTNYESHTSPEAQYRLYKILLPISVEKSLPSKSGLQNTKEGTAYLATPKTNHEVAQLTGTIDLEPGQSITIRVPSGVTGPIDITYHGRVK